MTQNINLAICGVLGRMGRNIANVALNQANIKLIAGVEKESSPHIGNDLGKIIGKGELDIPISENLAKAASLGAKTYIDFTVREASLENLKIAKEHNLSAIIGTTGFTEKDKELIQEYSKSIAIFLAPNMSLGVNIMYKAAAMLAKALGDDFDMEVLEIHHKHKIDAPSGTSLRIQEVLAEAKGWDPESSLTACRHGQVGPKKEKEIGVMSIRGGETVGEHTVFFSGPGERLEITHRAQSRENYAFGAVKAAIWLADKKTGLYSMNDMLNI